MSFEFVHNEVIIERQIVKLKEVSFKHEHFLVALLFWLITNKLEAIHPLILASLVLFRQAARFKRQSSNVQWNEVH